MIPTTSTEFWIAVLFIFNFFIIVYLFLLVKRINGQAQQADSDGLPDGKIAVSSLPASQTAEKITDLLEPLVEESRQVAVRFESQIKEKKRLIKELNEALDSRIISINLLLSRADAQQQKLESRQERLQQQQKMSGTFDPGPMSTRQGLDDQQNQILSLYYQNVDVPSIARKLSIPEGEVRLVIDLKEKFVAMEKESQ
jgi:hypothetical protein